MVRLVCYDGTTHSCYSRITSWSASTLLLLCFYSANSPPLPPLAPHAHVPMVTQQAELEATRTNLLVGALNSSSSPPHPSPSSSNPTSFATLATNSGYSPETASAIAEIEALHAAGLISLSVMRARLRRLAKRELAELEALKELLRTEIARDQAPGGGGEGTEGRGDDRTLGRAVIQ